MKENIKIILKSFAVIIMIILALIIIEKQMIKIMYKKEYSDYVSKYAQEYGVEENLIYALIKAESNFKSDAISSSNAKGLMQLMYKTAKEVAVKKNIEITEENILEPELNINIGTTYIAELIDKYGSIEVALAAYNAGSGNVDKWIKDGIIQSDGSDIENIPYKETNNYVRKIMRDSKVYLDIN